MIRGKFQKRERAGNESFHCNDGFHTTFRMLTWFKPKGVPVKAMNDAFGRATRLACS